MSNLFSRRLLTAAMLLLMCATSKAQLLDWIGFATHPGNSNVLVKDIGGDHTGNTYFLVQFTGTVTIESVSYSSPLDIDYLIVKRDANENLLWIRRIYGSGAFNCRSICADSAGSVYVVGSYDAYDTVSFDSAATGIISLPVYIEPSGYIGKYDSNGNFQWGKIIEGLYNPNFSIQVDLNFVRLNGTSIFVTSLIYGGFDYDPSAATTLLGGGNLAYTIMASYDLDGNMEWAKQLGSFGNYINYMVFAPEKKILIGGKLTGSSVDLDPGPANTSFNTVGSSDIFVTCFDSLGIYQWTRRITGNNAQEMGGIAMLSDSHFVVCGITNATIDIDPTSGVCSIPCTSGEKDFLAIYNLASTFHSGGETNTGAVPEQIFCNGHDEVIIYGGTTSGHYAMIFVDTGFNIMSFNAYGGSSPGCSASCTYFRYPFTLFVGGHCGGSNLYGNDGVMNVYASTASYTGFAAKYYLDWGPQGIQQNADAPPQVSLWPNPASDRVFLDVNSEQGTARWISVYDATGKLISKNPPEYHGSSLISVDVAILPRGYYTVVLETERTSLSVPLIIVR